MLQSAYQRYQQMSVQTTTPINLVLMLYDGAIRFTKQGIEGIELRDHEMAHKFLCKAQSVIHELVAALDLNIPIARDLSQIYEYLLHLLIQANVKKDRTFADEALQHLEELRESWRQIAKTSVAVGN